MNTDNMELQKKISNEVDDSIGSRDYVELARMAYHTYGRTTGNKNFAGGTMPAWDDLPELIRVAWTSAVSNAVSEWVAHVSGDLGCFLRAYSKGEPTFTLRAQDRTAFAIVVFWILNNPQASATKLREAFTIADRMRAWRDQKAAD